MESFYTFANFFRILAALGLLFYLVPYLVLKCDSPIQKLLTLAAIALTVFQALLPVTPREETRHILSVISWVLTPGAAAWLIIFVRGTGRPDLRQYQAWIIDTLRESVLIFDQHFTLQESSGLQKTLPPEESAEFIDEITTLIKPGLSTEAPAEGFFRFGERTYRYRFQPVNRGFLLTLLDLTEEQLLLDDLLEKNQLLLRQHTLLETAETVDLQIRREKYRQNLSSRILEVVREKLLKLQNLMNHPEDIAPILRCAEEAMADIRLAVGQLARGGDEK